MSVYAKVMANHSTKELSDAIEPILKVFAEENASEQVFFDTVLARFLHFDQQNQIHENKHFSNDVQLIIECVKESLDAPECSKLFPQRIDAYFYMIHRLGQYIDMSMPSGIFGRTYTSGFKQLKEKMLKHATDIFNDTKGLQPNLCLKDKDLLRQLDCFRYILDIDKLGNQNILLFLCLCKLAFQVSVVIDGQNHRRWIDLFSHIKSIDLSLEEFIEHYNNYALGFRDFQLNVCSLIYLLEKLHLGKNSKDSPFVIFIRICTKLHIRMEDFLEQFQQVFDLKTKSSSYKLEDVGHFLNMIGRHERMFNIYLNLYAANVDKDKLWKLFLYLGEYSEWSDMIQNSILNRLKLRFREIPIDSFLHYIKSGERCMEKMTSNRYERFKQTLSILLDSFLEHQLSNVVLSQNYYEKNLKEFLKASIKLSSGSVDAMQRPGCALTIRALLFHKTSKQMNLFEKIRYLFRQILELETSVVNVCDPKIIVPDECLQDFLPSIPGGFEIWFTGKDYQILCDNHQNNPLNNYLWNRILQLSFLQNKNNDYKQILLELNQWMVSVRHHVFDPCDTLTILFVINLFDLFLMKYRGPIIHLPKADNIVNYIIALQHQPCHHANQQHIDEFLQNIQKTLRNIVLLEGHCSAYRESKQKSIIDSLLPHLNIKEILQDVDPRRYKFPVLSQKMTTVISTPPKDIDTTYAPDQVNEFYHRFIREVNSWLDWFEQISYLFLNVCNWLKTYHVEGAAQLYSDLHQATGSPGVTMIQLKGMIEETLRLLQPFNDLERLCHLLNCARQFQIIHPAAIDREVQSINFIQELKRLQPKNCFTVKEKQTFSQPYTIYERRRVQWTIAAERLPCYLSIVFHTDGLAAESKNLYDAQDVAIDKNVLQGEFETQKSGSLVITIDNTNKGAPRTIWCRIKQIPVASSHLFQGIFKMRYESRYKHSASPLKNRDISTLLQQVFDFIDKLLDGRIKLREMSELKTVFCARNVHVREEVKNLFTHRSSKENAPAVPTTANNNNPSEQDIVQVCEWLQIYQYYSHVNIILECIERFEILRTVDHDTSVSHLKRLSDENCDLRQITNAYRVLKQQFQRLKSHHLQLIKTALDCSAVVDMMKKGDLYSNDGRRRFQELKDNLTTQFQLQERNNMILNSWIIIYALCEPFAVKAQNLEDFIGHLASLSDFDESSLAHLPVINDNIQLVNMWLSAEESTVLDNALITMEHLYRSGVVHTYLRRLINEESYFEIEYSVNKRQSDTQLRGEPASTEEQWVGDENNTDEPHQKLKFVLSMADIEDHKRQLTFCNVDLQDNLRYKKMMLQEQLNLLDIVGKSFSVLNRLEMAGHPEYQLKDDSHTVFDRTGDLEHMLTDLKSDQPVRLDRLQSTVEKLTEDFKLIYRILETNYDMWINCLETHRRETPLLQLFSNRQVMMLIILLTRSTNENMTKVQLLKKLSLWVDNNAHEENDLELTIQYITHYLRSLRIPECDLTEQRIQQVYEAHQIDSRSNADASLKKLCSFLNEIFNKGRNLLQRAEATRENQQYLITLEARLALPGSASEDHDFNANTICTLLNIFDRRLPSFFQILWCSTATEDEIHLFFSRIRTFRHLTFAVLEIDNMHHRLREILLSEQDALSRQENPHAPVYYFSREWTSRKGLRPYILPARLRNPGSAQALLADLFRNNNWAQPHIKVVCGAAGIGKTHRIKMMHKKGETLSLSINDRLHLSALINSFLAFDSVQTDETKSIFFNISIHAPLQDLNRTLFSLLGCGSLVDTSTGLTFSLPVDVSWRFLMEIPHDGKSRRTVIENFNHFLPLLSIIAPNTIEEVTDDNYQLHIGDEEELVARIFKAYQDKSIDRLMIEQRGGQVIPVEFDRINEADQSRDLIRQCLARFAPDLSKNKISQISFIKFLHRRVQFFTSFYYQYNTTHKELGSTAMKQMIDEAKSLSTIDFGKHDYPRIFLVYDPNFSLHLLHDGWNNVPRSLRDLFKNTNPEIRSQAENKNHHIKCLAWLIDIQYEQFSQVMHEMKFILTENFTYKLFHVHERKLTKLPLIIEGDTGVGKTFLLKFYSLLLNANITKGPIDNDLTPRIPERTSIWLWNTVLSGILKNEANLLSDILEQVKGHLMLGDHDRNNRTQAQNNLPSILNPLQNVVDQNDNDEETDEEENEDEPLGAPSMRMPALPVNNLALANEPNRVQIGNGQILKDLKSSLENYTYTNDKLRYLWKKIISITHEKALNIYYTLVEALYEHISSHLTRLPLIEPSVPLQNLLKTNTSSTINVRDAIDLFDEFVLHTQIKPLFYRLLLHPGVTEEQLEEFMKPIGQLALQLRDIELVVFFDEVNTSSCLGLFKEMFIDRTLHGKPLPDNIFFTAAINPSVQSEDSAAVHRVDYLVHKLPQSLEPLKVTYGALEATALREYIENKIATFHLSNERNPTRESTLEAFIQRMLTDSIMNAQEFCEKHLGHNSVSQREIQRCFNLIQFFWTMRFNHSTEDDGQTYQPDVKRCIALALALTYYFRLPTQEDNTQRGDHHTPPREKLVQVLSRTIPDFSDIIQTELETLVNAHNFVIPQGVAINQAIREHIFAIVVSVVTRTPLCIIGAPGQSKTLSFQIVLQNLQGAQLSPKQFCKSLPAIDPFFCLGSKYSRSEDIAYIFERAIKREQHYQNNRINTRCVVFLDEASLPDENKMVLKVLHPYLDECKVAFVAIANKSFDAANANRMMCIYRSLPSEHDQKILAYGCLGLELNDRQTTVNDRLQNIIGALCQGYRRVLASPGIPHIFHDRDFIYMLRELRFELAATTDEQETSVDGISPDSLLRALEDNFNGITRNEFERLVEIFFKAVQEKCADFRIPLKRRNVPTILRESMKLDSIRRRLYGRYKLIIDESEDESAVRLLAQSGVLDLDPTKTTVFRMSDFSGDVHNELRNVEILSTIKLCMETGKTILMVNTGRIHGSLYDVFNQNFSIMATGDTRKIWSKVAIGPKTIDVVVHEDFQCIVHVKRSEFKDIPAPFLSRFQKYSLSVNDFYRILLEQLPRPQQHLITSVEQKAQTFLDHFGREYFYGLNENTLHSCLLSFIKKNDTDDTYSLNVHQQYTQLNVKSKAFIEQNPTNTQQCLLRALLSKLTQLVSPEAIILKLPSFEETVARCLCTNYFQQQEHFNIENFIGSFIFSSTSADDQQMIEALDNNVPDKLNTNTVMTTKVMIFTRTSANVIGLNEQSKREIFTSFYEDDLIDHNEKISILNLSVIENSAQLEEQVSKYEHDEKTSLLIVVINARTVQQRLHIPYVRQLIDNTEYRCNTIRKKQKYFLLLIHSPAQTIYHQSSFPAIFLHDWDFYFFDSCLSGNAFHLQRFLQVVTSTTEDGYQEPSNQMLCDLNSLFDDCLWDFCSRIQIFLQDLPKDLFEHPSAYEFYSRQTSTLRRVQCLKQSLQQATQLQKRIVGLYHSCIAKKKESSKKIYTMIYQISKDILCGKRFDGLVNSIQSETRLSFNTFVSNILQHVVNDYGLETLPKLSDYQTGFHLMLELIDNSSFSADNDDKMVASTVSDTFQLITHYTCIPQTPLYHLFHQKVKSYADEVKLTMIQKQTQPKAAENDRQRHYYAVPPTTTTMMYDEVDETPTDAHKFEHFRFELSKALMRDKLLAEIARPQIVQSYSNDLVQTCCTIVEKNFDTDRIQYQKTIEFVSRWLLLVDENDQGLLDESPHQTIWLLAHAYASFEYDHHDLFSLYSACRIMDRLDPTRSFYEDLFESEGVTRANVREELFRRMFDHLWENLRVFCLERGDYQAWMLNYALISKYYPSEKVLGHSRLVDIRNRIEFMNLAHLILFNDKTPNRQELLTNLMETIDMNDDEPVGRYGDRPKYSEQFPLIIEYIDRYLHEHGVDSTSLLIDIQQWVVNILKSTKQSCQNEIIHLLRYLDEANCRLPWSIKQFLFDELSELSIEQSRMNRAGPAKPNRDSWDRFLLLLPVMIGCVQNLDLLRNYQVPSHPSVMADAAPRSSLIDLLFFRMKRMMINEVIRCELLNKILQSTTPTVRNREQLDAVGSVFKQFKDYFLVHLTGVFVCQPNISEEDEPIFQRILSVIISTYLTADRNLVQLTSPQSIFFSTIISKKSWNFLAVFFRSNLVQQANAEWATTFSRLLQLQQNDQTTSSVQLCHRIQFTLSTNTDSSIFPELHQPYDQLRQIIHACVNVQDEGQRWASLTTWIQEQRTTNPPLVNLTQIKVMLLLNIYYDFYCQNRLPVLQSLLPIIENQLQPLAEERLVFRALIQPEQAMIGYPRPGMRDELNELNRLFGLNFREEDELGIRHCLVNLMAMILLGGKQSFLWTFAFEPLALEGTFGFGSTARSLIQRHGVHYDCGCVLSVNGDLLNTRANQGDLNVPAIYVVYFATFGAMAWHLLLFDQSVNNLHGPILAPHAVGDKSNAARMVGQNLRTKVCHFVRARLLSTFGFLSNRSNQDDACILMNRSFERMTHLILHHQQAENNWIKPVYKSVDEELKAEKEYQSRVFFHIHGQLEAFKAYINHLTLQSQIQNHLQQYITQIPMMIHYQHFKTELNNPNNSTLSLNSLRYVLNSSDFLSITRFIYDLSQFYLLIHQTYSLLIERAEFESITLEELHQRGQNYRRDANHLLDGQRNTSHMAIIQNGINAVNAYHAFTDGLIRPGACDATQRFSTVSLQTPVHYLVTTGNHDDGNIIMRVLSVLVDYHDGILSLLEKQFNENDEDDHSVLKYLVNKLTSKEVSILQIARDNTGVITLNHDDLDWIEKLARASLAHDDGSYFHTAGQQLKFDFLHVQSYVVRTYLLLCRINYRHIEQRYQCHVRRQEALNDLEAVDLPENYHRTLEANQVETDWSHLRQMSFNQLSQGHRFLRQMMLMIKASEEDLSELTLHEFIDRVARDQQLHEQVEQYELKDFRLYHINHVRELYANFLRDYQHLFTDVSHLLHVPIAADLDAQLVEMLQMNLVNIDYQNDVERLKSTIQTITDLLNDTRALENFFMQQSARSLTEICGILSIDNSILALVPEQIKCENYVAFSIHLIRTRAILQERAVNIKEKETQLWFESFDEGRDMGEQSNRFHQYLHGTNAANEEAKPNEPMNDDEWDLLVANPPPTTDEMDYFRDEPNQRDMMNEPATPAENNTNAAEPARLQEKIDYISLFELHLKSLPWSSALIFDRLHQFRQTLLTPVEPMTKAQKIIVKHPDGTAAPLLSRLETLLEKLKKTFQDKKYDSQSLVIVDKYHIVVDFTNADARLPRDVSLEYFIIDRSQLIQVEFHFKQNVTVYWVRIEASVLQLIQRFLSDHHSSLPWSDQSLGFFDATGKVVPDGTIADLSVSEEEGKKTVGIYVIEEEANEALVEILLRTKQAAEQTHLFYPKIQWDQIDLWLKPNPLLNELSTHVFLYVIREQNFILDHDQSIAEALGPNQSVIIDGIRRDATLKVKFSYETNSQTLRTFKSMRLDQLLNDEHLLRGLNLMNTSSDDYVLVIGENMDQILAKAYLRKPVGDFFVNEDEPVHFRISLLVQIFRSGHRESEPFPLFNTRITLRELFEKVQRPNEQYQYIASNHTKRILDWNEQFSTLNQNKFILVQENETCSVRIQRPKNAVLIDIGDAEDQTTCRFTLSATIADVCRACKIDSEAECLIYADDFVPSINTPLNVLIDANGLIPLTISNQNFPIHVIVENTIDHRQIKFHCASTMNAKRLHTISCQLFGINGEFYQMIYDDCALEDDEMTLEDILDDQITQIEFQLKSTTNIRSSIEYAGEQVIFPCRHETMTSSLIEQALQHFRIPKENRERFQLIALADDGVPVEDDFSIEEIYELFPLTPEIIPFQLKMKD